KRNLCGKEKPAAAGVARGWTGAGTSTAAQAHSRRNAGAAAGPWRDPGGSAAHGNEASAHSARDAHHALRMEGVQTREVQCHRVCKGWRDYGRRRWTDEPRRFRKTCCDEGAIFAGRYGGRFRRVFSI